MVTEAPNLTLTDDNTYRFDQSDASNANHPLALGVAQTGVTVSRTSGTPGTAGAYSELVVGSTSPTTYLNFTPVKFMAFQLNQVKLHGLLVLLVNLVLV